MEAYYSRGIAKNFLKRYIEAISDYNKALDILRINVEEVNNEFPKNADIKLGAKIALSEFSKDLFYNKAIADFNLKDYLNSIADYSKALEIDPKFAMAYVNRGEARGFLKDYYCVIDDCTKAIEINSKLAEAYFVRGYAKIELEQEDEGCLDLSKAGELGYKVPDEIIKEYCHY